MKTPEEAARLLAHAINEWGGCFDCCTDGGAALDQLRPDDDPNAPNGDRIEAALLDLVKATRAETLAGFTEWFAPAYTAPNGNTCPTGPETIAREFAASDARDMASPEDETPIYVARRLVGESAEDVPDLLAEIKRLREGIEALHGAVQEFGPCPDGPWGCDELTCTESVHSGEWYHDDQPTGRVCLTCRYEDGEPHDWPCETADLLNPPTEGERTEPAP